MDFIWCFKNFNMGRELEVAGEFVYESAHRMIGIESFSNEFEVNSILYNGAVGVERLQKILLCLYCINTEEDINNPIRCLMEHNHLDLHDKIQGYIDCGFNKNHICVLGVFSDYYNNFRYSNYMIDKDDDVRSLIIRIFKRKDGKADFDSPMSLYEREGFIKFYINLIGEIARKYFDLIREKAHELNMYTYEIDSSSNAVRVFWTAEEKTLYEEMRIERISTKELLIFLYKCKHNDGVFRLMNDLEPLNYDFAFANEYISELSKGKVSPLLVDYTEDLYTDFSLKEQKDRKEIVDLIGNTESFIEDF